MHRRDGGLYCRRMPFARNGDVTLAYETFGDEDDPALVLLHGLGMSMLTWDEECCQGFADRQFFVIRMDHRDSGLSTVLPEGTEYTLAEMAGDVVAVMSHAGASRAVVCGFSLGGMVAQMVAALHPERVAGLVSAGSNSGEAGYGEATPEAHAALIEPAAPTIAEQVELDLVGYRIWSNPAWRDEDAYRHYLETTYNRAWHPGASDRQIAAVQRTGSRADLLRGLDVPALVVHGAGDPLIAPDAGRRTAELIPGAEYLEIEGMRHVLAPQMWPQLIQAVTALSGRITW